LQWFFVGYSLSFSQMGSWIIGNFDHLFLQGVMDGVAPLSDKIPAILFCLYQMMFAAITPALILGGPAERVRFLPATIFVILWTTFVYDFLAYWTWNPNG
jgi:Amt family ammonium transporter